MKSTYITTIMCFMLAITGVVSQRNATNSPSSESGLESVPYRNATNSPSSESGLVESVPYRNATNTPSSESGLETVPYQNATNASPSSGFASDRLTNGSLIPLYIGAFFPLGGGWDGSGNIPAVEMALDDINAREDVLSGYELRMVWNDTQCEAGLGTRVLFDQIYSKPQKLILLGGGCSTASQAIAATAYHWNLVTMSYAASSPALSNRVLYPYFYRTYSPESMNNPARARLMRDFNWTRVSTLHENHEIFSSAMDDMHNILVQNNINLISAESFAVNPRNQIINLKKQDARIIVAFMYQDTAARVFCEAYHQGITGKGYVWIILGWYNDKWWQKGDVKCSRAEMREAVRGYISMRALLLGDPSVITVANITSADFVKRLKERLTWPRYKTYDLLLVSSYGYDAAWAIALMLNHTANVLKSHRFSDNRTRRLEEFNYDDAEMTRMFFDTLNDTKFIGVSGPISFQHGDRVGITQVKQFQVVCENSWHLFNDNCYKIVESPDSWIVANATCQGMNSELALSGNETMSFVQHVLQEDISQMWARNEHASCKQSHESLDIQCPSLNIQSTVKCSLIPCTTELSIVCVKPGDLTERRIGLYNSLNDEMQWLSPVIWSDDQIPLDHTPVIEVKEISLNQGVSMVIFLCFCSLALIGIILALFFLAFNVKMRQQRSVKLSSPKINNLIILGSLAIYLWIILYGCNTKVVSKNVFLVICKIRHWFLSIGFLLSFGAMFSKTWRVYRIAVFRKPKKMLVRDVHLFIMVSAFLCFDVLLLVIWQVVDAMTIQREYLLGQNDPDVVNQIVHQYFDYCHSHFYEYWLAVLGGYKALLLIFGAFLAWETRTVTIKELNDSKLIGISVYNVVILCAVGVAVSMTLSNPTYAYIFLSCIALFCTSATLSIIFVPKIIGVYRYPEGKPISTLPRSISTSASTSGATGNTEIDKLQDRIDKLEQELHKAKQKTECKRCSDSLSLTRPVENRV